jgi:hypothetical protein
MVDGSFRSSIREFARHFGRVSGIEEAQDVAIILRAERGADAHVPQDVLGLPTEAHASEVPQFAVVIPSPPPEMSGVSCAKSAIAIPSAAVAIVIAGKARKHVEIRRCLRCGMDTTYRCSNPLVSVRRLLFVSGMSSPAKSRRIRIRCAVANALNPSAFMRDKTALQIYAHSWIEDRMAAQGDMLVAFFASGTMVQ